MSSLNGHHAVGGPSPGGPSSFPSGAYSNISSLPTLSNTKDPFQRMGSSHSKSTHPAQQPSSVAFKGISAAVAGGIKIKRAFATRKKKSEDPFAESAGHDSPQLPLFSALSSSSAHLSHTQVLNITGKKSAQQQPSSPPPPTPPKHDKRLPSPLNSEHYAANRISVLPITPGITPAVNYMLQQQQTIPAVSTPTATKAPPSQPQPHSQQSAPAPKELEKAGEKDSEKVKIGSTDNMLDKRETKETWRKSDSTNSHHTIRPGGGGGSTRTSRPVSWAESFQSTHTIVQVSNKRLSALITDANFGMPEEDDESFVSVSDNLGTHPSKPIPPSLKVKNRRSMSLNQGVSTISKTPIPPPLGASVTEPKHSISEGVSPSTMSMNTQLTTSLSPTQKLTPVLSLASSKSVDAVAGQQSQSSTPSNIRGRFVAWTAESTSSSSDNVSRQERTLPSLPPQERQPSLSQHAGAAGGGGISSSTLRQTAISMTAGGLGPAAAGLAKRAVEKIGRKWVMGLSPSTSGSGSGYSSSSSSTNAPSSFSSASHTDYGLVRTSSNQSTPSVHSHIVKSSHSHGSVAGGCGKRRTPDAPSGAYSVHSVASKSDKDPFFAISSGPILGTLLRGGLRSKNGVPVTGGVVFGRELRMVTRETGVNVGNGMGSAGVGGGKVKEGLVLELEGRLVPAIVVRCAQHLLIWGVQEEGLFRVNGRPSHVSKLRSEFDSGVDYDMTECSPGDLDPHAVASIFKAYLRELPESILTHALSPYFDAAIRKEAYTNFPEQNRFSGIGTGNNNPGLPQAPKGGFVVRKPPSLSTLTMPTFSGIPPPSTSLVADIRSLVSQLPQENYDLLRTVVDLIKATGKESKKTKMPLSNLMLVFCPSLNMTPPLLKVFCEAEGIWAGGSEKEAEVMDSLPPPLPIKDGQSAIAKQEEAAMTDDSEKMEDDNEDEDDEVEVKSLMSSERASLDTTDDPNSGYHASEEEEASLFEEGQVVRRRWGSERNMERPEIPTVYLDTRSHYSSSSASLHESLGSSGCHQQHHHRMNSKDDMAIADDDGSISSANRLLHLVPASSLPLCSSSVESVATPTSESNPSFSQLPAWDDDGGGGEKNIHVHRVGPAEIVDPNLIPILSPAPTTTPINKASISHLVPINDDAVQFPRLPNTSSARQARRLSISLLSLPNFSPASLKSFGDVGGPRDDDSPCPSPSRAIGDVNMLTKRSKRPSLRLLFSKKSGSSLNSLGERNGGGGSGRPFISNPVPQHHPQGSFSSTWESGTSDSSGSTPLSAVTASSGMSSRSHLPPVLDTPIEDSSLSLDLGFGSPETARPLIGDEEMREQQKLAKVGVTVAVAVASPTPTPITATASTLTNSIVTAESTNLEEARPQTPIASRISIVSEAPPPSPVTMLPILSYPSLSTEPPHPSSPLVPQRPSLSLALEPQSSSLGFSISSAPSPQLSLFDDGEEDEEDWTQSVLSAANRLS